MAAPQLNRQAARPAEVDIIVLTLLEKAGLQTVFDLFSRACLSPGSTAAALRRMQQQGLVKAGEPGKQRRVEFRSTDAGKEALAKKWDVFLQTDPADFDSAVRRAWLVESLGGSGGADQLRLAARSCDEKAAKKSSAASKLKSRVSDLADLYGWMKTFCDARRLQSEAGALRKLAQELASELPRMAKQAGLDMAHQPGPERRGDDD